MSSNKELNKIKIERELAKAKIIAFNRGPF